MTTSRPCYGIPPVKCMQQAKHRLLILHPRNAHDQHADAACACIFVLRDFQVCFCDASCAFTVHNIMACLFSCLGLVWGSFKPTKTEHAKIEQLLVCVRNYLQQALNTLHEYSLTRLAQIIVFCENRWVHRCTNPHTSPCDVSVMISIWCCSCC